MIRLLTMLYEYLRHNQNQFASGGLLLMVIGAIGASLRKIPTRIWNWIVDQTTLSITINDDNRAFWWLKHWFDTQRRMKKIRRVDVYAPTNDEYLFNPAPGGHWMFYGGRPIHITLHREEVKKEKWSPRVENFVIKTLGRDQKFLRRFVAEILDIYTKKQKQKAELHRWDRREWLRSMPYDPRPLGTVIMEDAVKAKLIRDIERFKSSQNWYTSMGIPYHRGYLFYGPPGTGKTSLVVGLSSHFQAKVYLMKLSEMNDDSLASAMSAVEANGMVVMEDIDCLIEARDRSDDKEEKDTSVLKGVTLSGLLNVIDGILASSGVMFFMTTNRLEKLDPALVRPGRVDVKLFIGDATPYQKEELYSRFFPDETIPKELLWEKQTMAELQEKLLVIKCEREQEVEYRSANVSNG